MGGIAIFPVPEDADLPAILFDEVNHPKPDQTFIASLLLAIG